MKKVNREPAREVGRRKRVESEMESQKERYRKQVQQRDFLSRKLVTLLEEEKRNMGNILHDEIGQTLTAIHLKLEDLKELNQDQISQLSESVESIQAQVRGAIMQTKNLSHNLRADTLRQFGLESSIRNLIEEIQKESDLDIQFEQRIPINALDTEQNLVIFRVVQEALTNILRHAAAHCVEISLILQNEMIRLSIEDDGQGFDHNQIQQEMKADKISLGINIMRERVFMVDGEFQIESRPGAGTLIRAQIPL